MAVTYSWRLDSNKYAYILPPFSGLTYENVTNGTSKTDWDKYGFLSTIPLTDYFAQTIAKTANEKFGEGVENGLSEYEKAFAVMKDKIEEASTSNGVIQKYKHNNQTVSETFNWKNADKYDMLSADMYFNVDSSTCADLRGVGIKGTRYLGSVPGMTYVGTTSDMIQDLGGQDLNNMSFIAKGSEVSLQYLNKNGSLQTHKTEMQPGIPGFTDVYGIYMTDTIEKDLNGEEVPPTVPEYTFVIRNGKDGARGPQGAGGSGESTGGVSQEDFELLQTEVNNLKTEIEIAKANIATLLEFYNDIMTNGSLTDQIAQIQRNKADIAKLQRDVAEITGGSSGDDESGDGDMTFVSGSVEIVYAHEEEGDRWNSAASNGKIDIDEESTPYDMSKSMYLLGYVPQRPEEGSNRVKATKLIAIPYIYVNDDTIEIQTNLKVDGNAQISGDLLISGKTEIDNTVLFNNNVVFENNAQINGNLKVESIEATQPIYASKGFFQESGDINDIEVENVNEILAAGNPIDWVVDEGFEYE